MCVCVRFQEAQTLAKLSSAERAQLDRGLTGGWAVLEKAVGMTQVGHAHRLLFELNEALAAAFEQCDVIACPALPFTAARMSATSNSLPRQLADGREFESPMQPVFAMIPFNFSGHPACALRAGISCAGLPVAIQLVAPRHRDDLLLQIAHHFEAQADFHQWPESGRVLKQAAQLGLAPAASLL